MNEVSKKINASVYPPLPASCLSLMQNSFTFHPVSIYAKNHTSHILRNLECFVYEM